MKAIHLLNDLIHIIYPVFVLNKNSRGEELVFLKGLEDGGIVDCVSNTQCEATENHVHLFDRVNKQDREAALGVSLAIARNLKASLQRHFPERDFVVYLDLNYDDSVIVRFHQRWIQEPLYYEPSDLQKEYEIGQLVIV